MSVMVVFSKQDCTFCERAKALLQDSGISYDEVDVTNDEDYLSKMRSAGETVPRIWHGSVFVGGYSELCDYILDKELVDL